MAVIGYLGKDTEDGLQFAVSREVFRTPKDMKWSGAARYATHARHATHALTEFTGLDPDQFSFDILLTRELGVDPLAEIARLWSYERGGEALGLVIGGKAYGKYRWNVVKHETKIQYTDGAGNMYAVEVSLELVEYLRGDDHNTTAASAAVSMDRTAAVAAAGGGTTYTVKKGDCMWSIARRFYGSGAQYMKIYEANRELIGGNPALIHPGYVLVIPA